LSSARSYTKKENDETFISLLVFMSILVYILPNDSYLDNNSLDEK